MLIFADTGETWTFQDVEVFSNRVANFFKYVALLQTFLCHYRLVKYPNLELLFSSSRGLRRGDAVAIYMTSQPMFIAIQMGLAKIGVISSLINSNLTGEVRHLCDDFITQIIFH